jgi:DNA polymerase III alpha subunit
LNELSKTIWYKNNDGYSFKKSHAVAYAHLVVVHMNLLEEQS